MKKWLGLYHQACVESATAEVQIIQSNLDRLQKQQVSYDSVPQILQQLSRNQRPDTSVEHRILNDKLQKLKTQVENIQTLKSVILLGSKLKKHSFIDSITVTESNALNIATKMLQVKGNDIGKFNIVINLQSEPNYTPIQPTRNDFDIRIHNQTFRTTGGNGNLDHWHVQNGRPCWGGYKQPVFDNLYSGQIYLSIDSILHYLLSPGDAHAYMPLTDWLQHKHTCDQRYALTPAQIASEAISPLSRITSAIIAELYTASTTYSVNTLRPSVSTSVSTTDWHMHGRVISPGTAVRRFDPLAGYGI